MHSKPYQSSMEWFEGVVENRMDPLEVGRVQVRVFGIHTQELTRIPESDLHWMQVMTPTTSASTSGVGENPNLVEGTHVVGFWRDGESHQDGLVMGTINGIPQEARKVDKGFYDHRTKLGPTIVPGPPANVTIGASGAVVVEAQRVPYPRTIDEPDLSRLARNSNAGTKTVHQYKTASQKTQVNIQSGTTKWSEPMPPYAAKYPYNHVRETESGHAFELDDTPAHERINIAHRTGSFLEFHPNGTVVSKAVKDAYQITHNNSYEHVVGEKLVTIDKGSKLTVAGSGGNLEIEVAGSGNLIIKVAGDLELEVEGDMNTTVAGVYTLVATSINLN